MPPPHHGTYVLILQNNRDRRLSIGRRGVYSFSKGYYGYVGSAFGPGGLQARIRHHLEESPKPHWHIDYLRTCTLPVEVWWTASRIRYEHDWAVVLSRSKEASGSAKGFGSSDCTCETHLFHFRKRPRIETFQNALNERGCRGTIHISRCSLKISPESV